MLSLEKTREDYRDGWSIIPPISDEMLEKLYEKIKPVVRYSMKPEVGVSKEIPDGDPQYFVFIKEDHSGDLLYYIEDVEPRKTAFIWSPKPVRLAENLEYLDIIETYHTLGAPAFFKPSIAEVLSQIPTRYIDIVVAFETIADGLTADNVVEVRSKSYHKTTTKLYGKAILD